MSNEDGRDKLTADEIIRDGEEHRFVLGERSGLYVQIARFGERTAAQHMAMAEMYIGRKKPAKGGYVRYSNGAFVISEHTSSGVDAPTQDEFDTAQRNGVSAVL